MARPNDSGGSKFVKFAKKNALTVLTLIGVILGIVVGMLIKPGDNEPKLTPRQIMYVQYPGEIFLRMLKCLIIPLLVASITSAIGSLDLSMSKRIAFRSIIYYFTTTICAVILGIILVTTIRPGIGGTAGDGPRKEVSTRYVLTPDTLLDLIRNLFPPNIVQATIQQSRTELIRPANFSAYVKPSTADLEKWDLTESMSSGTNVLGIVMFSIIMGATIGKMGETGRPLLDFFLTLSDAMMIITSWVIWISPIGVFFLVLGKVLTIESLAAMIASLGYYFMTVMLGLFMHGLGTIPLLFFIACRKLPYKYIAKMSQVLATAFGTGSSSATMPITIGCLDKMGIDPRVTRFVIPVGATINMDGTALYEAVAAIFIAQLRGISLTFGHIVAVSVTATAASIGAAGIPQAGLVTMVMVLDTVGLPADDVTIIISVDWLLDRFRTTINVMCDALGAILVNYLSKDDFATEKELAEPHELVELGSTVNGENKE